MTSRYSIFVSVAKERNVGGERGRSSESESSESDNVEGTRGGVAIRLMGSGRGGNASISRRRS
jgi:hypothetical protein